MKEWVLEYINLYAIGDFMVTQTGPQARPKIHTDWELVPLIAADCIRDTRNYEGINRVFDKEIPEGKSPEDYFDDISRKMGVCIPVASAYNELTRRPEFLQYLGDSDVSYVQFLADHAPPNGCTNLRIRFLREDMRQRYELV